MFTRMLQVQRAKMWGDPMIPMLVFIQPLMYSLLFGYMYEASGRFGDMSTMFIGVAQISIWQVLLYAGGVIVRHDFNRERTVVYSLVSLRSLYVVWGQRLLSCILLSIPALVVSFLVGALVFHVSFHFQNWWQLILGIALYFLSLFAVGINLILLLSLTPRGGIIIQTLGYPIFMLSGMIVSVDLFPKFVRVLSDLLPITWSTRWIQQVNAGNIDWMDFLYSCLISITYLIASVFVYRFIEKQIKKTGEISL